MPPSSCRGCGCHDLAVVFDLGTQPLAHRFIRRESVALPAPAFPLQLVQCARCGLVQLADLVPDSELSSGCPRFSDRRDVFQTGVPEFTGALFAHSRPRPRDLVVEACAEQPSVLGAFWRRGARVLAIEPTPMSVTVPRPAGLEIVRDTLNPPLADDLRARYGSARWFLARDVLPYTADPLAVLCGVQRLLSDDGRAVLEMPHLSTLVRTLEFDRVQHERRFYFSLQSLTPLAESAGLAVVDADPDAFLAGNLRVWLARRPAAPSPSERVGFVRQREELLRLTQPRTWRMFAQRVKQVCERIRALVGDAERRGERIVGYGVSSRCAALLNAAGIQPVQMPFVFAPAIPTGKPPSAPDPEAYLFPGMRLPIVSSARLAFYQPEQVLILDGTLPAVLESHHPEYVRRGGRFLEAQPRSKLLELAA